jgi:hypothetical protein
MEFVRVSSLSMAFFFGKTFLAKEQTLWSVQGFCGQDIQNFCGPGLGFRV